METALGEILVLPFFGQGHLFPCMELCKHFASHNFKATFVIPSNLSSSVPSTFHQLPFIEVVEIPNSSPPPELTEGSGFESKPGIGNDSDSHPPWHRRHHPLAQGIESFLSERYANPAQTRPGCVVIDVMMNWSKESFTKLNIPIVSFFTSGACTSAMEYAKMKDTAENIKPGETRIFPGLPENMTLSYADIQRHHQRMGIKHGGRGGPDGPGSASRPTGGKRFGPPEPGSENGQPGGKRSGPPEPGKRIPWWEQAEGSMALLFNTCDDLDGPFIKYIANQIGKPVWGVGPMLPEQYWKSAGSVIHDHEVRSNRESSVTEDEVMDWLNSKPSQSVIYISFGSEVGPTLEEYAELSNALGELNRPFIWVIQPGSGRPGPPASILALNPDSLAMEEGYYPHGLDEKVGERGLIIKGWAPQLLILSHPSVGGFLSHCGWNSTVEAIGRGVPILAWPIRGDQFYNAKLIANHLEIGHTLLTNDDPFATMKKDEIMRGINLLMDDEEVHKQAMQMGCKFQKGFPASSAASLKSFIQLVGKEATK